MAHNYMKIFLNYIHNKRMQLKTMKYHFHPLLLLSCFSRVRLCATPWTEAHQAPPSMGLSRQEYWSGLPLPSPNNKPTCV